MMNTHPPSFHSPQYMYDYCYRYFKNVGAVFHPAKSGALFVELPREVDKELTDRPFYWMWVEAMNENPPNAKLYLTFTEDADVSQLPEDVKAERMSPGCYRMLRIIASAKSRGSFAVAYEPAAIVSPFALFVVKISYLSDRRKDFLTSYAIDLRDYSIYENAIDALQALPLQDDRPLHSKILPVPVDYDQLFTLLMHSVRQNVEHSDHRWANEASKSLREELSRLDAY